MAISMLKIRRPLGRLIFNMGIAIPGKTVFLIETAPKSSNSFYQHNSYYHYDIHISAWPSNYNDSFLLGVIIHPWRKNWRRISAPKLVDSINILQIVRRYVKINHQHFISPNTRYFLEEITHLIELQHHVLFAFTLYLQLNTNAWTCK